MKFSSFATAAVVLPGLVQAQLSGSVGPTTSTADKRTKVCNVLDYGGVASKTSDIGPPITSAFADCKSGGTVYVPPGDYGMSTWVTLSGGSAWAFQLDGIIYRVGTDGGNMIFIEHTTDFEFYSSTSGGAIQGYGYEFHKDGDYGCRLLRLYEATDFSVHDIALVDAPQFHLVLDDCYSGELYNMVIYGGYEGGLDGIDIWGENIWVHDIEVSNKDECVTVKSPAHNMLIEDIYCNVSGGCAMGSLGADTNISNIYYKNVYTHGSNQMFMIKSYGGSGTVNNCTFENFIGHSNAYSLDFNAYWTSMTQATGDGVEYTDINFIDWTGTAANGVSRAPINVICPDAVPCTDVAISDFAMWTDAGSSILYKCENAYGSGGCLKSGTGASYAAVTSTITSAPAGYSAATMPNDLASGFPISSSIPIPTIGTTYFPGATPVSKLLGNGASASQAASGAATAKASSAANASQLKASSSSTLVKVASSSTSKKAKSTTTSTTKKSKSSSTVKVKAAAVSSSSSPVTSVTSYTSLFTTYADSVTIATTLDASVSASLYGPSPSSSSTPLVSVVTQVSVVTVVPVAASSTLSLTAQAIETESALGEFTSTSAIPSSTSVSVPSSNYTSQSTTLTVYATSIYTITSCAASITDCPARASESTSEMVVTDVITLTTTVCPVLEAESASSEVLAQYSATVSALSTATQTAAGEFTSTTSESAFPVETGATESESSGDDEDDDEDTCE